LRNGLSPAAYAEHQLFMANEAKFGLLNRAQRVAVTRDLEAVAEKLTDQDMAKLRAKRVQLKRALRLRRLAEGWEANEKLKEKRAAESTKTAEKKEKKQLALEHSESATLLDAKSKPSSSLLPKAPVTRATVVAAANPETKQSKEESDMEWNVVTGKKRQSKNREQESNQQPLEAKPASDRAGSILRSLAKAVTQDSPSTSGAPFLDGANSEHVDQAKSAELADATTASVQASAAHVALSKK
jgi:hypothetical protein